MATVSHTARRAISRIQINDGSRHSSPVPNSAGSRLHVGLMCRHNKEVRKTMRTNATSSPTVTQMRIHVATLCSANEIIVNPARIGRAYAIYQTQEIFVPPVKSNRTYATALHEIGHILGRHQLSEVVLVRERWAWKWAKGNALYWNDSMQRYADWCLEYYERTPHVRRTNGLSQPFGLGSG
jgi:hypothetical protein